MNPQILSHLAVITPEEQVLGGGGTTICDEEMVVLAEFFGANYRKDFLLGEK